MVTALRLALALIITLASFSSPGVGLLGRARRSGHQCRGLSRLTAATGLG